MENVSMDNLKEEETASIALVSNSLKIQKNNTRNKQQT